MIAVNNCYWRYWGKNVSVLGGVFLLTKELILKNDCVGVECFFWGGLIFLEGVVHRDAPDPVIQRSITIMNSSLSCEFDRKRIRTTRSILLDYLTHPNSSEYPPGWYTLLQGKYCILFDCCVKMSTHWPCRLHHYTHDDCPQQTDMPHPSLHTPYPVSYSWYPERALHPFVRGRSMGTNGPRQKVPRLGFWC